MYKLLIVNVLMPKKSRYPITKFILDKILDHPQDIASLGAKHFGITTVTMNRYLKKLVAERILTASGTTKGRQYKLNNFYDETLEFPVTSNTQEDVIWRKNILPFFESVNQNVTAICQYGVTEMINNVIDHSGSDKLIIHLKRNAKKISIKIIDYGIGIFEKIRRDCNLEDSRQALLELSKGKLTTDPKNHSGQGVFFTSRMFEKFAISSGELFYSRSMKDGDDWLIEVNEQVVKNQGTTINLEINTDAEHTASQIFTKYQDDDFRFARTHVPVRLARYGHELLVSRSQAKRILARFDKFEEVILDFQDVSEIGQAFADEIFRVFKNDHPEINIHIINAAPQVLQMIKHVEPKHSWEAPNIYTTKIKTIDSWVQDIVSVKWS